MVWEHRRIMVEQDHPDHGPHRTISQAVDASVERMARHGWRLVQVIEREGHLWAEVYMVREREDLAPVKPGMLTRLQDTRDQALREAIELAVSTIMSVPSVDLASGVSESVDRDTVVARVKAKLQALMGQAPGGE